MKEKIDFSTYRAIPLDYVMSLAGGTKSHRDKNKWNTDRGHITITGFAWYCHEICAGGGGAIDLAAFLLGLDARRDILAICEFLDDGKALASKTPIAKRETKPKGPLVLPTRVNEKINRVKWYLHSVRKLPWSIINLVLDSGNVYADEKGNVVFLYGYEPTKHVVAAELRGTVLGSPFHMLIPGSDKVEPFTVVGGDKKVVGIGESPISAMSYLALNPGITVTATAGAGRELPLAIAKKYHAEGYTVISINDNDSAGDMAYDWLCGNVPSDLDVLRDAPDSVGDDWNDVLKAGRLR